MRGDVQSEPSVADSVGGTPPSPSAPCRWQPWHTGENFAFCIPQEMRIGLLHLPCSPSIPEHPRQKSRGETQCRGLFPAQIVSSLLSAVLPAVSIGDGGLRFPLRLREVAPTPARCSVAATLLRVCAGAAARPISVPAKCFEFLEEGSAADVQKSYYPYISQRN